MDWKPVVSSINELKISGFVPHTDVTSAGIVFATVVPEGKKASLLLYEKGSGRVKCELPFPEESNLGLVKAMIVSGVPADEIEYNYRIGEDIVTDPAAQVVVGLEKFGDRSKKGPHRIRGGFAKEEFDWEGEQPLTIPYEKSVFYELHVRGFTKHSSSKVKHKGTFLGIVEKIPYLKELGITAVVLMPAYEFDEIIRDDPRIGWRPEGLRELLAGTALPQSALEIKKESAAGETAGSGDAAAAQNTQAADVSANTDKKDGKDSGRVNYWGYGPGWYFAPKRSYCATDDPATEFRTMVKSLHQAGIEVIMQMAYPAATDPSYMQASLFWWRQTYHVDGFVILANQDEVNAVAKSPALCDVKLICDYFDTKKQYPKGRPYHYKNLAEYNVGFRYDARRMLKGDAGMLRAFVERTRYNPMDAGVINAITGHDGFTLADLVSYNDKHNEANGENNRDGAEQEFSWNCGTEGETRRKEILKLRTRQTKNALAMMLLSQGTPMITAGDEMGNTQMGNSNPYCFDSDLTWIKWPATKGVKELQEYTRNLIAFRKEHGCLHKRTPLSGNSNGGLFPDISIHGKSAWFASYDPQERSVGIMYCEPGDENEKEKCVYVAYNFHWEKQQLALPYLPSGREWRIAVDTSQTSVGKARKLSEEKPEENAGSDKQVRSITVPARTVWVLVG